MQSNNAESIRAPIFAILLFETFALIARSYLQIELIEGGQAADLANYLSYLIVVPILGAMMFPILKQHRHFLATRLQFDNLPLRSLGIAFLVGILMRIAYWGHLIGFGALGIYRNEDPNAIVGPVVSFACPPIEIVLLHLFVISLLVPIVEEVLNRGFFLYSLLKKGRAIAIISSSILFAIFHSPATIPAAFVFGLFLAVYALSSCSLWPPIVAHATFNALVALDWLCVNGIWNPREVTSELAGIGVLALLVAVCALIISARLVGKRHAGTSSLSRRSR